MRSMGIFPMGGDALERTQQWPAHYTKPSMLHLPSGGSLVHSEARHRPRPPSPAEVF
jgi:hypothetical protein